MESGNQIAIHDLTTGSNVTISSEQNDEIRWFHWNDDGRWIVYLTDSHTFIYDVVRNRSLILAKNPTITLLCGNWGFETLYDKRAGNNTLFSFAPGESDAGTELFTADSISLLSCAKGANWNPGRVGVCNPFCAPTTTIFTPTAPIPTNVDVRKLNLSGGNAANGQQLYMNMGCAGCHQPGVVAPATAGTYTRIVNERLTYPANAGETPEQYIAESILYPSAYVAPKFVDGIMPKGWGSQLTLQDLQDLVAYLMTQK